MYPTGTGLLDASTVVRELGLQSGQVVVDLFCGYQGFCTMPAARAVGVRGRVHAVDVRRGAVEAVRGQVQGWLGGAVHVHHAYPERMGGVPLPDATADVVFLVNALAFLSQTLETVREAHRLLKSAGSLAVVDWVPLSPSALAPPPARRVSEQQARSVCLTAGFQIDRTFLPGGHHWGVICKKP